MIINPQDINQDTTSLCTIMSKHGSDKALGWHNYTLVYDMLFKELKSTATHFFEMGIGTINSGASLRGWKEYFDKAQIYGADILIETLFEEDRIDTFHCDQLNTISIQNMWNYFDKKEKFDVILEDGLHTYEANIHFLEHSIHKVKDGGFYIIEDVMVSELHRYYQYFENCKLKFTEHQILEVYNPGNKVDNVLIIIKK
jgi:hypothetical protein